MTVKNTESLTNSSNETRSVFYCPESPEYIWDLSNTTSFKIIVAITATACPVTILLNLLVIIVVKTRGELKQISNILLSGVAMTDLLVGAISLPLSIALDALVINKVLVVDIICTLDFISVSVLHIGCWASFFHLILIAWERYVAKAKCMEYKAVVTRGRVNKYKRVAWMLALLIVVPLVIIGAAGVPYELIVVVDVILIIFWFVCLSLIAYFYVKVYLTVRTWNRTRLRPANVRVKGKLESKFAYTTFWLAVFFAVSGLPSLVVYIFRGVLPIFRQVFTIRWVETIFQLNSLFNPLLYWYKNRRLRKATLELLRCRNRTPGRTFRFIRQRRCSVASLDVQKLQREQRGSRLLLSSKYLGSEMCLDTFRQSRSEAVMERPAPSRVASDEIFTQQGNQVIVTAQIENAPGSKSIQRKTELPKNTMELGRSRRHIRGKTVRSVSLSENSSISLTKSHNVTHTTIQRSKSRNFLEPKALHVEELTNEDGLPCNCYEETKL